MPEMGASPFLLARSPSSALSPTFLGEGFPSKNRLQKTGTLVLASLLENLVDMVLGIPGF